MKLVRIFMLREPDELPPEEYPEREADLCVLRRLSGTTGWF